ncbi:MAG: hypothetical protein JW885_03015 [Deltaproteobacteria bacterium]|nr:hypothetical protein [Candidatus Zymogenaceae bacterium]
METSRASSETKGRVSLHPGRLPIALFLAALILTPGCSPSTDRTDRLFSAVPTRYYESVEISDIEAAQRLLGIAPVDHLSPLRDKLDFFSNIGRFTFSMAELSYLLGEEAPLGFDPGDFRARSLARTESFAVTVVLGDFDRDRIVENLSHAGFEGTEHRGHVVYSLPWSEAIGMGGLPLSFSNLVFLDRDLIAHAPTERLLMDYLDRLEIRTLAEDEDIATITDRVERDGAYTALFIGSSITMTSMYDEAERLFIREPEDWGLPEYRLHPYTYYAFAVRPRKTGNDTIQDITLILYYQDETSPAEDRELLFRGLTEGISVSRNAPFCELFSVEEVDVTGRMLTARLFSIDDFDIEVLIRLADLPFLVY